jgi:hypothetical protein
MKASANQHRQHRDDHAGISPLNPHSPPVHIIFQSMEVHGSIFSNAWK